MSGPQPEELGARIREEREAAGFKQEELAEKIGLDPTMLSKVEHGTRRLDSLTLRRISRQLQVPMEQFFAEGPPMVLAREGEAESMRPMLTWARQMRADLEFVAREAEARYGG